jgi:hypothetical protein
MKTHQFIVMLAVAMLLIWGTAMMVVPKYQTTQEEIVAWLEEDCAIHRDYLNKPESLSTGDHAFHLKLIDRFEQIICYIKLEPTQITRADAIRFLDEAQASHAGHPYINYETALHHYTWFQRYEKIKEFLKRRGP